MDSGKHSVRDGAWKIARGCCLAYIVAIIVLAIATGVGEAVDAGDAVPAITRSLLLLAVLAGFGWYLWWAYDLHQREQARRSFERKRDELQLRKRAEAVGASLSPEVLKRLNEEGFPWEQVARSALQSPKDVDYVCDTDYRQIDPYAFEEWTATLFGVLGCTTEVTNKSGDKGIDVHLEAEGWRGVVQCKQNAEDNRVGLKDTKEFLWGARKYDRGYMVTTSGFTKQAQQEACGTNVMLIDGSGLSKWVTTVRQIRAGVRNQSTSDNPHC
jgi:restriction endonuclease Mrr